MKMGKAKYLKKNSLINSKGNFVIDEKLYRRIRKVRGGYADNDEKIAMHEAVLIIEYVPRKYIL